MALNIERFKADLNRLLKTGHSLQLAIIINAYGKSMGRSMLEEAGVPKDDIDQHINSNYHVVNEYHTWYSESLALIRQLLPDRVSDFRNLYEIPKGRKEITFATYTMSDFLLGLEVTRGAGQIVVDTKAAVPRFQSQLAILSAGKARFASSLFEMKQLVQADLFDSEIDIAREFIKNNFLRAAGAVAAVVLEKHLQQVCKDHQIAVAKKNPSINDLNELLKSNSVIDIPQWRHISLLGDLRNLCVHSKQKEPRSQQVTDLVDGTEKIIKTVA